MHWRHNYALFSNTRASHVGPQAFDTIPQHVYIRIRLVIYANVIARDSPRVSRLSESRDLYYIISRACPSNIHSYKIYGIVDAPSATFT
uniref:Uncharacterized protein n=1 Tax=Trichogramma kaykai TaxID=54128 RepID=A0ABD2XG11_9HYME